MATEVKKEIQLEIAHLLFIDVVGYSKLLVNEQIELMQSNCSRNRMFPRSGSQWKTDSSANRGRDGAAFFPQPGTTGALRARNQSGIAQSNSYPVADGNSQRPGQSGG